MKALIFDTETTGLVKHPLAKLSVQPKIIEFGALLLDEKGNELESYNVIVDPQEKIDGVITKITGLTQDDPDGQALFADVLPEIRRLFEAADLRIAHNLPFDDALIRYELQRLGVEDFPWTKFAMCTVKENQPIYGKRPRLIQLYEDVIGEPLDQTHRAIDDCRALAAIVKKEKYIERFAAAAKGAH